MNMGSVDRSKRKLLYSFKYAIEGLIYVIKNERNMQIHLTIACIVLFFGFIMSISKMEWLIILLLIGIVLSLETMNTAIERTVDLITDEYKPLAKLAKDVAAAAVFVFAIISVIIGIIIFLEPIQKIMNI
ncbi:diacylglycerol kinase family protein [Bacillus sp. Marseille-P3661]|uniref:diacylglycerol kinase family protein n=1 Tax=Bacillus sp. Marseille-P3661 TaxID=1936234 RepID=UPI000C8500E9|nr:diacylglycerol kinase family protein [Bacillus sp. Marseille-P3661]